MSYYPPQGGYYPQYGQPGQPPHPQYAAGAPIPGYPVMQPQVPPHHPPATGAYPGYPPQPAPYAGYPGAAPPPAPYGYAAPQQHAPQPYGYPGTAPAPAHAAPVHTPTMPLSHAPTMVATMPLQTAPSYYAPTGPVPTPQQDAETIHAACKGFGTDEKRVISVVAVRTSEHLAQVASVYRQFYGRDLVDVLKKETSGHFGRALHYLILPPLLLDAELVHDAIVGAGTNERCLIQVLVGRTNADMAQLKSMYYAKYHKSLESDVKGDVSGYFEKLLMMSMQGMRDEIGHYQYNVEADARYGKKFTRVIKKEFSGWVKTGLVYLVSWITNPAHCVAKHLEKSMAGAGTDDQQLTRLLVRNRTQPFMNQVKAAYQAKYRKTLRDRIKGETSGDYRRTLFSIIGEPERG
ncbi:Annexin A7 [Podila epicladia]|nr:Annexin A7 [Podila epicladia]